MIFNTIDLIYLFSALTTAARVAVAACVEAEIQHAQLRAEASHALCV